MIEVLSLLPIITAELLNFMDKRNSDERNYTCICLSFPGASLVGRGEYILEDSPSLLSSMGLLGRSGKPKKRTNRPLIVNESNNIEYVLIILHYTQHLIFNWHGIYTFIKHQL